MNKFACTFGCIAMFLSALAPLTDAMTKNVGDCQFYLKADRDGSVYKVGETAVFTFRATKNGKPLDGVKILWQMSKDSVEPVEKGSSTVVNGECKFERKLDEAGFVKCNVVVKNYPKGKSTSLLAGAGFDPMKIKASMPVPGDFKSYWQEQRKLLNKVAMNPVMNPVPSREGEAVEVFDVCADSYIGKMRGYYARPAGAKAKSCPAIILPHGAGVRSSNLENAAGWAKKGFIALDFNAHGIPNGQPKEFYSNLMKGELKDYRKYVGDSRDDVHFREMFIRDMRALDFIKSQPEWNGKVLVVFGKSQGGGQAIASAALDGDVTLCVSVVPALCDHSGAAANRASGWPRFSELKNGAYDKNKVEKVRYVDAMNFAALVKCPTIFVVGLADPTCVPTSVYSAYSNISAPKEIINAEECTHVISKPYYDICRKRIIEHAKAAKN